MTLHFEPARKDDVQTILDLNKGLIDRYEDCASIDYDRVVNWVHDNILERLDTFCRVIVAGQPAGYFSLGKSEGALELDSLFVLPRFQNQGIGTQILRYCQQQAPDRLFLYVFKENTGALRLYTRLGFEIVKEVRKTAYVMEYKRQG